jgi:glyoxylase-like metal-dependent hydrolase (beta-lactamase superfamily II)
MKRYDEIQRSPSSPTRRELLGGLAAGGALTWLGLGRAFAQTIATSAAPTVADAAFASLLSIGDRMWATVSKPLEGKFDTLCNGGLVAGKEGVLAFDCYASAAGAGWLIEQSRAITGLPPTDVVLSHHHGDHTGGLGGFAQGSHRPQVWTTRAIRDRVAARAQGPAAEMLAAARLIDAETTVDLGGRSVVLTPLQGHTPSDVVARVDDQALFCGDLVWNGLFPNYVDALPDLLGPSVDTLLATKAQTVVPGHGPLPDRAALDRYKALIGEVEAAGRASFAAGKTPEAAAAELTLSPALGEWTRFSPDYFIVAMRAWHRRLKA